MNEKGFATIFGLCLILIIALYVRGIQEAENNHAHETSDFQIEFDLQNAADSGIYMAARAVKENPNLLPNNGGEIYSTARNCQVEVLNKTVESSSGSITVDVWGERLIIKPYKVDYSSKKDGKYVAKKIEDGEKYRLYCIGYILMSRATIESEQLGGKLYRRSFAYVIEKRVRDKTVTRNNVKYRDLEVEDPSAEEGSTIYFMESVTRDDYSYDD